MTLEQIQNRLLMIEIHSADDQAAHEMEDALYLEFIQYVATLDIPSLAGKAREVLKTKQINFQRYTS